jgi:hypothetical protein
VIKLCSKFTHFIFNLALTTTYIPQMISFKKILLVIFAFYSFLIFSQKRNKPVDLQIKGDYTHLPTSAVFPSLWSGFQREAIFSYDLQNKHVVISYVQQSSKKSKTVLTLYVYPKKSVDNQLLRDEFSVYETVLNQNSNKGVDLKPMFGSTANDKVKVNYIYSIFDHAMGESDFFKGVKYIDKKSLLSIYECGGWGFKIRVSSDEMTSDQLADLKTKAETYFGLLDIASKKPLPISHTPDIILSPTIKRDSMMINAVITAAQAKIKWLGENSEKKELLTGFNDMNIYSEIFATEKMIEFYKDHEKDWPMHEDTKKYFAEIIKIADNGKIKDYLYDKYNRLIHYDEGEAKKDEYLQFKTDKNITENTNEVLYKIFYNID